MRERGMDKFWKRRIGQYPIMSRETREALVTYMQCLKRFGSYSDDISHIVCKHWTIIDVQVIDKPTLSK